LHKVEQSLQKSSVALTPKQIVGIQAVAAARLFHHNMLWPEKLMQQSRFLKDCLVDGPNARLPFINSTVCRYREIRGHITAGQNAFVGDHASRTQQGL